jgi:hypothetical protein
MLSSLIWSIFYPVSYYLLRFSPSCLRFKIADIINTYSQTKYIRTHENNILTSSSPIIEHFDAKGHENLIFRMTITEYY